MSGKVSRASGRQLMLVHLFAGGLALQYAWLVSGTRFVTTGVQFVSPLVIVLLVHLAWLVVRREFATGYAVVAFERTLTTSVGMLACTVISAVYAPVPAVAEPGGGVSTVLFMLACLAVLALVVAVPALILYGIVRLAKYIAGRSKGQSKGPNDSRLLDGSLVVCGLLAISMASLEGITPALTFNSLDRASTSLDVAASPERVWQAVGTATSPSFALPTMLQSIPQPVAVIVDEGADLGARRIVRFKGREGQGDLVLQVVRRSDREAVFEAVSDGSPIAKWVRHRSLTFQVEANGKGSRLTVALEYERLLSPAWFFRPYVHAAAYLAADVLGRDTRQRAEDGASRQ